MIKEYSALRIAVKIWFTTNVIFGIGWLGFSILLQTHEWWATSLLASFMASIFSSPAIFILKAALSIIKKKNILNKVKTLINICLAITFIYGLLGACINLIINYSVNLIPPFLTGLVICTVILFACTLIAIHIQINPIKSYLQTATNLLPHYTSTIHPLHQINTNMETTIKQQPNQSWEKKPQSSFTNTNKTMIKAIVTAVLILAMMIPTLFISNLVSEREERQKEVVKEVTSKWATQQTITSPYLYIPYLTHQNGVIGKGNFDKKYLLFLPENLKVNSIVIPEQRPRSIYKVLLYKSNITAKGDIKIQLPKDINPADIQLADAKICMGLTDFKGIEERVSVNLSGNNYELTPGLPTNDIDSFGLSAPINLTTASLGTNLSFEVSLKVKGSEKLYFTPLAGNSSFSMQSNWGSPSFDGNILPSERTITDNNFTAKWTFNKASLPFGTTIKSFNFNKNNFAFGVSLMQPADQYAKTSRSVKYAILIIGLTFALFFIIELMQQKALHPIQYIFVGLALIIFYTLLLSISEFILFDYAYLIAATATVVLIMLYAKSHFNNWKTASIFGSILSALYGFIFVLIRLEDTALLVGSIGLFIVLALVMYTSRKINWFNPSLHKNI
ncbi:MAG: cell envelope integrity protein CreD [Pedobacter sp.]|nr:cell envelope integrity protein CreD [Chitinophagaceae bacterium]